MLTILDLFCGCGGAARGYKDAGFHVVGVDRLHQPDYSGDEFIQMDAMFFTEELDLSRFDAIHASPPCQAYSHAGNMSPAKIDHPRLVEPMQILLAHAGLPYIMENVPGAPLDDPIQLCGTSFGLGVDYKGNAAPHGWYELRRHRLFETNMPLEGLPCRLHQTPTIGLYGNHASWARRRIGPGKGQFSRTERAPLAQQAMRIDWSNNWDDLKEAIPPVYTEYLGKQLRRLIEKNLAASAA